MIRLIPIVCIFLFALKAHPQATVVQVGSGSYRLSRPTHCKPLPTEIYKTDRVKKFPTNQWWSSIIWQPFSQNLFGHPIYVKCDEGGLIVGYQGRHVHGNNAGIFGSGDLVRGDFTIGHSKNSEFSRADCDGYSDWFVTALFKKDKHELSMSFGQGSPFVYGMISEGNPKITFVGPPTIWGGSLSSATLGITINGNHYGLFGESGSQWIQSDDKTLINQNRQKKHFSVAILPDNKPETLEFFSRYAHSHVTNTRVDFKLDGHQVISTFQFRCTPREGNETQTLFALYPHQWKYTDKKLTGYVYGSVRGEMKLASGLGFKTSVPVQGVLPYLPGQGILDTDLVTNELISETRKPKRKTADTYWEGKHLGSLATLSGVAEATNRADLQKEFIQELKNRLESWFIASPNKEQPVFYYDDNWHTIIGSRPSYGSDLMNDHHFHYGYFIRAAAEIARNDKDWAESWGPMVEILIRDIATPNRDDDLFPYLRCFDKYAGHSWASGDANFGDGNNQESSSESLNAWYSLMLWGEITQNKSIRDLGVCLYNIERTAVEEYWFDVSSTNYPKDYPHVALGMVWGGKGAFATWFSGEIDHIHGINWLPFTPASIYMGRHPKYVQKNFQRIIEKRTGGQDFNSGWGDLVLMFGALNDPTPALSHVTQNPNWKTERGNSRAFMYHWISTLETYGQIDKTTTSEYPFTNVFLKNGKKTYMAYNFHQNTQNIKFSDGKNITVPSGSLVVK